MTTVGFIGLGSMGMPMADNLLAKGFAVQGFDVRGDSVAALASRGARPAASAAAAAAGADALVLMVVNAAQAEQILFGDGALESLPDGSAVILMATCPPGAVAALAARVEAAGRRFVDAPVSGGVVGAVAGILSIMAAAPAMSYFIFSMPSAGLIEMPPVSKVMPLPTNPMTGASLAGALPFSSFGS